MDSNCSAQPPPEEQPFKTEGSDQKRETVFSQKNSAGNALWGRAERNWFFFFLSSFLQSFTVSGLHMYTMTQAKLKRQQSWVKLH